MNINLAGKVAIITGAARGIGRGIALALGREGASVVIDDIELELARLVEEEARASGIQAVAIKADVTKLNEAEQMVEETLDRFGRIDILVNNAGIWYIDGKPAEHKTFRHSTEDDWRAEMDITLFSALNCSKAVLETISQQGSGSIVNIASDAAQGARGAFAIYSAGKAGMIAFSRSLANELGPSGIRVNCIAPGTIRTSRIEAQELEAKTNPDVAKFLKDRDTMLKRMPIGRVGMPQDIANVAVFLASDVSSYVTGQTFYVNGGRFMS